MNFEERKAEIFRRSQARIAKRRQTRRIALGIAVPVVVVALLAAPMLHGLTPKTDAAPESLGFTIPESQPAGITLPETEEPGGVYPESAADSSIAENIPTSEAYKLVINPLKQPLSNADMDVEISGTSLQDPASKQDFQRFTGWSLDRFLACLPDASPDRIRLYTMSARDGGLDSPYTLHEYILQYHGGNDIQLRIAISPLEMPLRDCSIVNENAKLSQIHGVTMVVHGIQNTYYTGFYHRGVYFDVETRGFTQEQLLQLLTNLIDRG